jgi:hypothetical protein
MRGDIRIDRTFDFFITPAETQRLFRVDIARQSNGTMVNYAPTQNDSKVSASTSPIRDRDGAGADSERDARRKSMQEEKKADKKKAKSLGIALEDFQEQEEAARSSPPKPKRKRNSVGKISDAIELKEMLTTLEKDIIFKKMAKDRKLTSRQFFMKTTEDERLKMLRQLNNGNHVDGSPIKKSNKVTNYFTPKQGKSSVEPFLSPPNKGKGAKPGKSYANPGKSS